MSAKARPIPLPDLPTRVQVGDRVKLKADAVAPYVEACRLAGYDFDPHATFVVIRKDNFLPGGGERLFIDAPPHALGSRDVQLAWNSDGERREMLRARSWRV